jgi:hypothetical protein
MIFGISWKKCPKITQKHARQAGFVRKTPKTTTSRGRRVTAPSFKKPDIFSARRELPSPARQDRARLACPYGMSALKSQD